MAKKFNESLMKQLQCFILPGRLKYCSDQYTNHYNVSYEFWKSGLQRAYKDEGNQQEAEKLTSDDFLRHEELAVLFHRRQPVGLLMFDLINLVNKARLDHSHMKLYPQPLLQQLIDQGHQQAMTVCSLLVSPDWRQSQIGPGVSDILTGFLIRRFLQTSASVILAISRNNRKTNSLIKQYGAVTLSSNLICHNVAADVLAVYRENAHCIDHVEINTVTEILWNNRIDCRNQMQPLQGDQQCKQLNT